MSLVNCLRVRAFSKMATVQLRLQKPFHASRATAAARAAYHRVMGTRILFVQEPYGFCGEIMKSHLITSSMAWAFYPSPTMLLGPFFVREMIIELGTPHATCLPCDPPFRVQQVGAARMFLPAAVAALSGNVRSTGVRFC